MSKVRECRDRLERFVCHLAAAQGQCCMDQQVLLAHCLGVVGAGLGTDALREVVELAGEYAAEAEGEPEEQLVEMFFRGFVLARFLWLSENGAGVESAGAV